MIRYLLSATREVPEILAGFILYFFPMQNVDGVIPGNCRFTPKSENLEMMWNYDRNNLLNLTSDTPPETAIIHQYAENLMTDGGGSISGAG